MLFDSLKSHIEAQGYGVEIQRSSTAGTSLAVTKKPPSPLLYTVIDLTPQTVCLQVIIFSESRAFPPVSMIKDKLSRIYGLPDVGVEIDEDGDLIFDYDIHSSRGVDEVHQAHDLFVTGLAQLTAADMGFIPCNWN